MSAKVLEYDKDNIERKPYEYYYEAFQKADPFQMSRDSGALYVPDEGFHLKIMGQNFLIRWPEFALSSAEPSELSSFVESAGMKILVLRYLLYGKKINSSGRFLSFREMPSGELYFRQFQGRNIYRFLGKYGPAPERFAVVSDFLGAHRVNFADVCYDYEIFDGLFVRFMLWEGDEEFRPAAQIVFSDNFRQAFETYDLAELAGILISWMGKAEQNSALSGLRGGR